MHRYGKYLRIREEHIVKAHAWFARVGHWGSDVWLLRARSAPPDGVCRRHERAGAAAVRAFTHIPAASCGWRRFIGLGYFLGERWQAVERNVDRYLLGGSIAFGVAIAGYLAWRKWGRR